MLKKSNQWITVISIIIVIIAITYPDNESKKKIIPSKFAREYMKDLKIKSFDEKGNIKYTIQASNWSFSSENGYSKLSSPDLVLFKPDGTWYIKANNGKAFHEKIDSDIKEIKLSGDVRIQKIDISNKMTTLTTNQLLYNLETTKLTTNEPVKLSSDSLLITGIGIDGSLNENSIKLLKKVKTVYSSPIS